MADSRDDPRIFLLDPDERGVLPLSAFHIPRRLRRTVRTSDLVVTIDTEFAAVVEACASPAPGREDTWINPRIVQLYTDLHARGHAHCIACWRGETLVGGLYGVRLGAAFFGESMFSRERDASKIALVHLVARLKAGGFTLLDAQFITEHLRQFGATEISRARYRRDLERAVTQSADFHSVGSALSGDEAVSFALSQPTTQTS